MSELDPAILARAKSWTGSDYDEDTRLEIQQLLDRRDHPELVDRFYRDLEFGTGGLRGVMGAGTNRMNVYTVRRATQGFANYIKKYGKGILSVVVGHDCRHRSREFALEVARVMAGNSIRAYVFDGHRPTPQVSFAVRHLRATAGINVTASHNPKQYNGYKAYWSDGGQVVPPHDKGIIAEVDRISSQKEIKRLGHRAAVEMGFLVEIGAEIDEAYYRKVLEQSRFGDRIRSEAARFKLVYTPLHGVGAVAVPKALKQWGFGSVSLVASQKDPDGDFPTVPAPNPEDRHAMGPALAQAKAEGADLILATDADSDRLGVGVKLPGGDFELLDGNQIAALMLDHCLSGLRARGAMPAKPLALSTIVTTPLLREIAKAYGVEYRETLTGFKWIAAILRECEEKQSGHGYVFGAEESFGYMPADYVRDKDAVVAACLMAEAGCLAHLEGKTLLDRLDELFVKHGFFAEGLQNFFYEGKEGAEKISRIMEGLRKNPIRKLAGAGIERIDDVKLSKSFRGGEEIPLLLPQSNVLVYHLEGGGRLAARPSGTEPKIKFYASVRIPVQGGDLPAARAQAAETLKQLQAEVDALVQKYAG